MQTTLPRRLHQPLQSRLSALPSSLKAQTAMYTHLYRGAYGLCGYRATYLPQSQIQDHKALFEHLSTLQRNDQLTSSSQNTSTPFKQMARRRNCGCSMRGQAGGFYPSVMYGLSSAGPYFVTAAFAQGARLIRNNKERMATRRHGLRGSRDAPNQARKRTGRRRTQKKRN